MTGRAFDPFIDMLIADAKSAQPLQSTRLQLNFNNHLLNAYEFVEPTDDLEEALGQLEREYNAFMRAIACPGLIPKSSSVDEKRSAFLAEVEKTRASFRLCQPSDKARHLGLDEVMG